MSKDIKKALEHCVEWNCGNCPNRDELGSGETVCRGRLLPEVLEYVSDLEAKLAEKDKEIEKLNACVVFYKSYYVSFQEKVIDELERVKEKILPEISSYVKKEFVVKEFDNQIKQLTHKYEDKGE